MPGELLLAGVSISFVELYLSIRLVQIAYLSTCNSMHVPQFHSVAWKRKEKTDIPPASKNTCAELRLRGLPRRAEDNSSEAVAQSEAVVLVCQC